MKSSDQPKSEHYNLYKKLKKKNQIIDTDWGTDIEWEIEHVRV